MHPNTTLWWSAAALRPEGCHRGGEGAQARCRHRLARHDRWRERSYWYDSSKTMREAIFQLTGFAVKTLGGNGFRNHGDISVRDVSSRVSTIVARETELIRDQLTRNTICDLSRQCAVFRSSHNRDSRQRRRDQSRSVEDSNCLRHATRAQPRDPL